MDFGFFFGTVIGGNCGSSRICCLLLDLLIYIVLQLEIPAQYHSLLHIAMCSALCNESVIQYNPEKRIYEKIGESTEVALRVLAEKVVLFVFPKPAAVSSVELHIEFELCLSWHQIGLPGFDSMPSALNMLSKHERASYCNRYWENQFKKVWTHFVDVVSSYIMFVALKAYSGNNILFYCMITIIWLTFMCLLVSPLASLVNM